MGMTNVEEKPKIKKFTDLKAWQESRGLVKETYQACAKFPAPEQYGLVSQMKRASVSIASNIAEGFRRDTMKDKLHFYIMAHGSLTELQNQMILAHDLTFLTKDDYDGLIQSSDKADALLNGLIRATKERIR